MSDVVVASLGFPAATRLRRRSEFQRLRRSGKKFNTENFTLYYLVTPNHVARLGLTVSRKVGNAVVRNKVKRRVREFFRTRRTFLSSGLELSLIARPASARLDQQQLEAELTLALRCLSFLDAS